MKDKQRYPKTHIRFRDKAQSFKSNIIIKEALKEKAKKQGTDVSKLLLDPHNKEIEKAYKKAEGK